MSTISTERGVATLINVFTVAPENQRRVLGQHPQLAEAVIERRAELAAALAQEHFSLTESMIRDLAARIRAEDGDTVGTGVGGGEEAGDPRSSGEPGGDGTRRDG